jgi:hypothetical protein
VGSEYWQLLEQMFMDDLIHAKGALEDTGKSENELRVSQGAVRALTRFHDLIVELSAKPVEEKKNGED